MIGRPAGRRPCTCMLLDGKTGTNRAFILYDPCTEPSRRCKRDDAGAKAARGRHQSPSPSQEPKSTSAPPRHVLRTVRLTVPDLCGLYTVHLRGCARACTCTCTCTYSTASARPARSPRLDETKPCRRRLRALDRAGCGGQDHDTAPKAT